MKICLPVNEDNGSDSTLSAHFGGAAYFLIVDSESDEFLAISNKNEHDEHGHCRPLNSLSGTGVQAVICAGIGNGALTKLTAAGITTYICRPCRVAEAVEAFKQNQLTPAGTEHVCSGHGCH